MIMYGPRTLGDFIHMFWWLLWNPAPPAPQPSIFPTAGTGMRRLTSEEFDGLCRNASRDIADAVVKDGFKSIEHRMRMWLATMETMQSRPKE